MLLHSSSLAFVVALSAVSACGISVGQPRPLPGVKAEGQAKEDKGKQTPPVKPDTAVEGATTPIRIRPSLVTLPAIPELREPTEQETAAAALGRIGRAAVPSLIQTLGHRDADVRRQVALVLARIGPDAADAVPELTALLDDPEEDVRKAAARALGQIGPAAAEAVPALMRQLVQPKPSAPRRGGGT